MSHTRWSDALEKVTVFRFEDATGIGMFSSKYSEYYCNNPITRERHGFFDRLPGPFYDPPIRAHFYEDGRIPRHEYAFCFVNMEQIDRVFTKEELIELASWDEYAELQVAYYEVDADKVYSSDYQSIADSNHMTLVNLLTVREAFL